MNALQDTSSHEDASRELVLVVEDNLDMNSFIVEALRDEFEVASAFNGRDGLDRALAVRPALIITDIMMPIMTGTEMIAEIQNLPEFENTPIIVLSAKGDEELRFKLLADGVQDYITKPFTAKEVLVRSRNLVKMRVAMERERQETAVAEALYRVASAFAGELDRHKLLQLVTDEATTLTGAAFGAFFFNVERSDGEAYMLYTLSGAPEERFSSFPMPRATPLFGPTFRGEGVIRLRDVRADPRYGKWGKQPEGHLPVVSYLAAPVVATGGEVLGGLFFGHADPGRFTEVHERIVRGLAVQAAAAIEKARLYEALRESEARAREADRRKDEFLAMLGHELRNPLAPIMTSLEILELREGDGNGKEREIITRQVRHLSRLVDDLLDIARVTRGKIEIKRERISLAPVVDRAAEMASSLFDQRKHSLRLIVPRSGLFVNADAERLAQVIANLLNNAAKYTEPGGSVVLTAGAKHGRVVISVKDNGQGLSADLLPEIFELFVQGGRSADRAPGGLGIGLSLVRTIVELHGGTVEARSDGEGCGSEFLIDLPAADGVVTDWVQGESVSPHTNVESKVLVVDDNVDAAETLAEGLRLLGHSVFVAHDAPRALAAADAFHADAALIDIGLPMIDGYDLARRLRAKWEGRRVCYIAVTGYGQQSDKDEARAAGFDGHFVKPVRLNDLSAFLSEKRRG